MKSQSIRLLDVAVVGPLMIWAGIELSGKRGDARQPWAGLLAIFGATTIAYNARHYFLHREGGALPGGRGDRLDPNTVSPSELAEGTRVEMEHTVDPAIAREIALDHLAEDPAYYTHLRAIERHPGTA